MVVEIWAISEVNWQGIESNRGVTASRGDGGIDRVTILVALYQSAVSNETKYRRLRLICCNKLLTISQLPSSS